MGFPKSLQDDSPIVIIDGSVYQYGKAEPNPFSWNTQSDPPEWRVEHHLWEKLQICFDSEEEMLDFIDGLPESKEVPLRETLPRIQSLTNLARSKSSTGKVGIVNRTRSKVS